MRILPPAWLVAFAALGCSKTPPPEPLRVETDHQKLADAKSFADVLGDDLQADAAGKPVAFDAYDLGELDAPSGKIVACDGLMLFGEPFEQAVPPGKYRVLIAVARLPGDERIAFARLQLADRPAVRWQIATCAGQVAKDLKEGDVFGYPVDSGTGAFVDAASLKELVRHIEANPEWFEPVIQGMEKVYRHTRNWARVRSGQGNAVLFSSGNGDGVYASYWGYDAGGNPVALVTDFAVVDWQR